MYFIKRALLLLLSTMTEKLQTIVIIIIVLAHITCDQTSTTPNK